MPTKPRFRLPERRDQPDERDDFDLWLEESIETRETYAQRVAWSEKNPHPKYPAYVATVEEWRAGKWLRDIDEA